MIDHPSAPTPTIESAIAAYDQLADTLAPCYAQGSSGERLLAYHADLLPSPPAAVLDVGAGSGVHAVAFAARGYRVVAVEPSAGMRAQAAQLFPDADIAWVDDRLPDLRVVRERGGRFAVLLVNAVWMHVPPDLRDRAMAGLAALAEPAALLSVALRIGPAPPHRPMHPVDPDTVVAEAAAHGFREIRRSEHPGPPDAPGVHFVRLCLRAPS
ncbi:MAG: class I SAM-dependent methyltransferase [Alphaproteobacteria bacterium]|nr:class I SAM-dependent methyltransferase [Alphaproteobacteria bacterium]